jgi:hypothetical protein
MTHKDLRQEAHAQSKPLAAREYVVGNTRFIVTSRTAAGAYEDAATKIRRLIRRDLSKKLEE